MLTSFFESFRYVGHLYPMAFLRIYIGWVFLSYGLDHYQGDFLTLPILSGRITEFLPSSNSPDWYKQLLESHVVTNWRIFAYLITASEIVIGVSYLLGIVVRPVSLLGLFLCVNFFYISDFSTAYLYQAYFFLILVLAWLGAGRCMGVDYFFFKRNRGIWW